MKRVLVLSLAAALICLAFQDRPVQADESSSKLSRQQEAIVREYEGFLDSLRLYVERWKDTNPQAAERLRKAIEFAKNADIKTKMKAITRLIEETSWFDAGGLTTEVDADLAKLEQILMGQSERLIDPNVVKQLLSDLQGIHKQMEAALKGTGEFTKLEEILRHKRQLEDLYDRQQELLEQMKGVSAQETRVGEAVSKLQEILQRQSALNRGIGSAKGGISPGAAGKPAAEELGKLQKEQAAVQKMTDELQKMLEQMLRSDPSEGGFKDDASGTPAVKGAAGKVGQAEGSQGQASSQLGQAGGQAAQAAQGGSGAQAAAGAGQQAAGAAQSAGQKASQALKAAQKMLQELQEQLAQKRKGQAMSALKGVQEGIRKETEGLAGAMKGREGSMGQAGKATQGAAESMKQAEQAMGQMGGGKPGEGGESGGGGKPGGGEKGQQAQKAQQEALKQLEQARKELQKAEAEAKKEIEKEKYSLKELSKKQKEIAEQLKKLREEANKSGSGGGSEGSSGNLGRAEQKSKEAAKKLDKASQSGGDGGSGKPGEGGESGESGGGGGGGAGGAKKDQEAAKKEIEDAMKKLQEQMEMLKMLQSLMKVEETLNKMIKIQAKINKETRRVDADRLKWMDENPGRRYVMGRSDRHVIGQERNNERDLAHMAEEMAKLLEDEGKFIFPEVLRMTKTDMDVVVGKLAKYDVSEETQLVEDSILRSLQRLVKAVHRDLETLKQKMKQKQPQQKSKPGAPKKEKKKKKELLPGLAEIKLLRIMQLEVNFQTQQLDEAHGKRVAQIRNNPNLSAAERAGKLQAADEYKKNLGRRLASKEGRIQNLVSTLIKKIKEAQQK